MKNPLLFSIFYFLFSIYLMSSVFASVPGQMNYQGILKDSGGTPLTGSYPMVFTIYDAASGGAAAWTETRTVTTEAGLYNIQLGSVTPLSSNVFDGSTRYLGVKVGSDSEMTPRVVLVTVPYAYRAAIADTALSSSTTVDADTVDGFHASATPTPNTLYPLNSSGYLSLSTSTLYAGFFRTAHNAGSAVFGEATSSAEGLSRYGGLFISPDVGVRGYTSGAGGGARAVAGLAASYDDNAEHYGAHFEAHGGKAYGLYSWATHHSGVNYGIYGATNSPAGTGIYGKNSGSDGDAVTADSLLYLVPRTSLPSGPGKPGLMCFYNGKLWVRGATTWEVVTSYEP